jgi:trimeric autotransporter adhesin
MRFLSGFTLSFLPRIHTSLFRPRPLAMTLCAVLISVCGAAEPAWANNVTTTTLVVKSAGSAVTTVKAGSVVTLTASVTLAGNPVTTGQVNFCDAAATHCTDIHLLGTSQLTLTGSASLSFVPGIGSFSYKAVFIPSGSHAGSVSGDSALLVTATASYPTTTSFSSIDSLGNFLFTATVVGTGGGLAAPVGTVSFLDTSNSNAVLTTAVLGPSMAGVAFANPAIPAVGSIPWAIVTADFNGDGIPDFATANYSAGTVTIELGNGDGTFNQVNSSPATGTHPEASSPGTSTGTARWTWRSRIIPARR